MSRLQKFHLNITWEKYNMLHGIFSTEHNIIAFVIMSSDFLQSDHWSLTCHDEKGCSKFEIGLCQY